MLLFSHADLELKPDTEFILIGIPIDCASTVESQARLAPEEIRKASLQFGEITETGFNMNQANLLDVGNIPDIKNIKDHLDDDIEKIRSHLESLLINKSYRLITLGGDHLITYPIIKALSALHGDFGLIIFDAHLDQYDIWNNEDTFSHCTVMRRIMELDVGACKNILYIGTRDYDLEEYEQIKAKEIPFVPARKVKGGDFPELLKQKLQFWLEHGINNVYVSIDIDVLDPSIAPGTGYKMPGGLDYWELWQGLKFVTEYFNIIGFDVVEVDPSLDQNSLTSIHAAKIIMEMIGFIKSPKGK